MKKVLEVCCGSYMDGINAYKGGAKRIELNNALYLGGLTPTIGALKLLKKETDLEVCCMVRPRAAGFCYNNLETDEILNTAKEFLAAGADGIVFGFLTEDKKIDVNKTKLMVELIHKYGKIAIFHRAIDVCADYFKSMEDLVLLGVDRVLTSGGKKTAIEGKENIKKAQNAFGENIEILAGSGVNKDNALDLIEYTGISQVHSSCKEFITDPTTSGVDVNYRYYDNDTFEGVSKNSVKEMIRILSK